MCGILGGWWLNPEQAYKKMPYAVKKIKHRGPDDEGYEFYHRGDTVVSFGHTRLSIIDLSAAGHQPMHSEDARWTIIFNGEIYNYKELRAELQGIGTTFKTDSDTEVLLKAWIQWNLNCLTRLVGMFAFAILDKKLGTLTCARDAFGIKPLYFTKNEDQFIFASEVPALIELLSRKPSLNWQRSYEYLVHGDYDTNANSFYEHVYHLEPGHLIEVDTLSGKPAKPKRWYVPNIIEKKSFSFDDAVECVRDQFLKNIQFHLRSDVPLAAALSGGIDSSAVVCAMRYVEPEIPIHTFSYIADEQNVSEEYWVDRVNSHVGAIGHKVRANTDQLANDLEKLIIIQGEPIGSTSIYAQYRVFQKAREKGIKVILDGQGADEMLAGYIGYPGQRIRSLLEQGQIMNAWQFWQNWANWPGRNRWLAMKYLVSELASGKVYELLRRIDGKSAIPNWINSDSLLENNVNLIKPRVRSLSSNKGRRVIDELALSLTQRGVPRLLRHGDRASMAFGLESRVPFLTLDMVNLLLTLPENYLISNGGETKYIFRRAMKGIVPDEILNRRDKIGFETPEEKWTMALSKKLKHLFEEDISIPWINQKQILMNLKLIEEKKIKFSWQVWRWINFTIWYRHNYL
jgi:asparagine synthase (glutamine-hydrolysing)